MTMTTAVNRRQFHRQRGPLPGQATTGLTSEQFDELVDRVGQRVVWGSGCGRTRALTLHQAVKVVVMYFRTNVTEELIAEALDEFVPDLPEELAGQVAVVDG